jgi:regulator of sigma E protease
LVLLGFIAIAQLGKIAIFLVTLSILVVLHEYGHFIMARRNGVRVNEFAVGMGPKILGWTSPRSGTLYSLRALPIGGYCAMEGEDGKTSEAEQMREFIDSPARKSDSFQAKSPWARLGIVVAGPVANFILAWVILFVGTLAFGVPGNNLQPVIGPVLADSPAQRADLRPGDRLVSINGTAVSGGNALIAMIHGSLHKPLTIVYMRNDSNGASRGVVKVTPVPCPQDAKLGCIGFSPVSAYERVGFFKAIAASGVLYVNTVEATVQNLTMLATHFTQYAGQVSGPIGMGQAAITVQDFGWGPYLQLAALISFALGVFNLLPLPALDGGRGAFIIAELIRGKPVDPEKEAMVHIAGLAALLLLMLLVAYHDIARIVAGRGLLG